ncbi:biotin-dependent carboxyltransferase family protein [Alicyclobacillus acidoterrestris]|uniref:Biotin-dependent carboxyltransferase family protein n=1 Tax=Alicyclobacillus acidoterrestris (strain ATCC 49025 / DSM 3922 / CIP 106132 / NCIMB 13137 / GD3B) TaxID=1356854 RepID=A0A9E6ZNC3_ALIAG|nr:biotin-dependent carboxyltransferase family protein [Alicyclobacillus acidoterrestris]
MRVLHSGMLTTIQDLGRFGFQKYGVIVSGAMDAFALKVANVLVGNRENTAALEMTLLGPSLLFEEDCLIAITGFGMTGMIDDRVVPTWRPVYVRAGSTLTFKSTTDGCRAYLAVEGGFRVPMVMNSASTYLKAAIGGYEGRALRQGDVLQMGDAVERPLIAKGTLSVMARESRFAYPNWSVSKDMLPRYQGNPVLRVIPGGQFEDFTEASRKVLLGERFEVSSRSDRMGYRLSGPSLELTEQVELISEAVTAGTVQVPSDGNPIILLADRQTIGGYPKIAQVIQADLPIIAQVRPGQRVGFELVTLDQAQRWLREQHQNINRLKASLKHLSER